MHFLTKHSVTWQIDESNQYSYFTLQYIYLKLADFQAFTLTDKGGLA